jgi:hypothetical protein
MTIVSGATIRSITLDTLFTLIDYIEFPIVVVNYNCNMFIVQATAKIIITIVNYDRNMFIAIDTAVSKSDYNVAGPQNINMA